MVMYSDLVLSSLTADAYQCRLGHSRGFYSCGLPISIFCMCSPLNHFTRLPRRRAFEAPLLSVRMVDPVAACPRRGYLDKALLI